MEQSIEELERAYAEADTAYRAAFDARSAASAALHRAKLNATGLNGHIIEGPKWPGSSKTHRILVTGFGWSETRLSGPLIKKDGTPGERHGEVVIANATDLGLRGATS